MTAGACDLMVRFMFVLIGVAGVLVVFVAVAATRPSAYHVERKLEIAAPADVVFGVLNDLRRFAGVFVLFGSAWEKIDPNMHKTFEGPAAGVGQSCAWSGNRHVGKGTMTIEESVAGEKVSIKIEFVKPMESTVISALSIAGAPSGSRVTWAMAGNHNFVGKAFGMVMNMDKMLGSDIEKGLAELKSVAERTEASKAAAAASG